VATRAEGVCPGGLFEFLLFRAVVGESQNSLHLVVLLCAGQWLTRKRDQAVECPQSGFHHFPGLLLALDLFVQ
jgi:hypothetical protein